jgi:hypothetical protein
METTSAKPGQTFVENWIIIHHYRILKYFYFNISYKGKIDSLTPPVRISQIQGRREPGRAPWNQWFRGLSPLVGSPLDELSKGA